MVRQRRLDETEEAAGERWTQDAIGFCVLGRPQQRGSKIFVPNRDRAGNPIVINKRVEGRMIDSNKKSYAWMARVRRIAKEKHQGPLLTCPVRLGVKFYFRRPKNQFRTGRQAHLLRDDSPMHHAQTPDLDKLIRAVADALTGAVLYDDCLICGFLEGTGRYWTDGPQRAAICIQPLSEKD